MGKMKANSILETSQNWFYLLNDALHSTWDEKLMHPFGIIIEGYGILRFAFSQLSIYCTSQNILVNEVLTSQSVNSLFLPNLSSSAEQQLDTLKTYILFSALNRPQTQDDALFWNLTPNK
jgi:hypothetical protein